MAHDMTHLLDTDVIINHIHAAILPPFPNNASLAISVITLAELLYGIHRSPNPSKMLSWLDDFISEQSIAILPIGKATVELFTQTKLTLEKRGKKLEDFDLLIAATALEHHLTLVTGNKKHFSRIPCLTFA